MSKWTHVNAAIRIDGIPSIDSKKPSLKPLPTGSEGPLQYQIKEYDSGLPWLAIQVWGDLRDYDDEKQIWEWFDNTFGYWSVRDAVVVIRVEGGDEIYLGHEGGVSVFHEVARFNDK